MFKFVAKIKHKKEEKEWSEKLKVWKAEQLVREADRLAELRAKNPYIKNIILVDTRLMYDTTWTVETEDGVFKIIRRDGETLISLCDVLEKAKSPDAVLALDEHDRIYYD